MSALAAGTARRLRRRRSLLESLPTAGSPSGWPSGWRANVVETGKSLRLKIVQAGEQVLMHPARELVSDEIRSREIHELIEHMRETMRDAPGVGLAAPQIGLSIQLAVIEDREEYQAHLPQEVLAERGRRPVPFHVIINPAIVSSTGVPVEFFEGCLSVEGFSAIVPRYPGVVVECLDENGAAKTIEASGWYARILQHEIDHLHGRLYLDRMHRRTLMTVENFGRFWKDLPISEVLGRVGRED
jgi:peptide deformylase